MLNLNDEKQLKNLLSLRKQSKRRGYADTCPKTGQALFIEKRTGDIYDANVIINKFRTYTEIVYYKEPFQYTIGKETKQYNEDGERVLKENPRFFIEEGGLLIPQRHFLIKDLQRSIQNSKNRALDNFHGYAQSNKWRYFITLSFSPEYVDRNDDEAIKALWKVFRQQLQRINKKVKCLVAPERHEPNEGYPKGALHFHGFLGDIDISKHLSVAIDPKTFKPLYSKCGERLYNMSCFKYGWNTCAVLPEEYNEEKVANYVANYITKQGGIGRFKKIYYRTGNLDFKNKIISSFSEEEFNSFTDTLGGVIKKVNDKMIVLRKYHDVDL